MRPKIPENIRTIHLMGICGTGMASLAGMLKSQSYAVSGSDQNAYPPMSDFLRAQGIEIKTPYAKENLSSKPDLVIIGNAISRGHVEAEYVLSENIPYLSMPECLHEFFLKDKDCLVLTGTHGKTTCSALLAWVLESSGLKPSFFIGGIPLNFKQNFKLDSSKYFILEGDEYDTAFFDKGPKFLHYKPKHVLCTSLEFDHADIYDDLAHIQNSFRKLFRIIPSEGSLQANAAYPALIELLPEFPDLKTTTYGEANSSDSSFNIIGVDSSGTEFNILNSEKTKEIKLKIKLYGKHNVNNALGVALIARQIGLSWEQINQAFSTFKGVKRRQEILGQANDITIIDDFAHHPTAVRETLFAMRQRYPKQKIWAIFEPRSNTSKSNIFQNEYAQSFSDADQVILAEVFMPEKVKTGQVLNISKIVEQINQNQKDKAQLIPTADQIVEYLKAHAKPNDVILVMSNGGFDQIHQKLLKTLA